MIPATSPPNSLNVSKWLKVSVLLDEEEMLDLQTYLEQAVGSFAYYEVQRVTRQEEGIRSPASFLADYRNYVSFLKRGEIPSCSEYRTLLSPMISVTDKAFTTIEVDQTRQLLKAILPAVQLQYSQISYSREDDKFRSQVFGNHGISWGIQIGYPLLYQDSKTYEILSTKDFPNTPLFHAIQKWIRSFTRSTPFIVDGKKRNEPIRIGKKCFQWIASHPELKTQGIQIDGML